jgi:HD superfamily phosphohydrolase
VKLIKVYRFNVVGVTMTQEQSNGNESAKKIDDFAKVQTNEEEERVNRLIESLLAPHKTIRDAVHKDVFVTHLETMILDTQVFQRIRRLKQLGLTNLVYPSANHTRFEHSIGTLFMADHMIEKINKNPYAEMKIGDEDRFIIRLLALLHDVGNLPFGHTLEDEGGLFDSQWSKARIDHFLSDSSEVGKVILNYPVLKDLSQLNKARFKPENVTREIRETLDSIEEDRIERISRPYIADIVGNTLCADLLDYSKRDIYFTGLTSGYDERFLSYLYVTRYNGKYRLVLRLIKPKTGRVRRDVLSELMDLLRLRYSLAEKVYYQTTKMIASAMLISAVTSMVLENKLNDSVLYEMDDDTLMEFLFSKGNAEAKHLASRLRGRQLYKIVYDLSCGEEGIDKTETQRKLEIIKNLTQPEKRYETEKLLENMSSSSLVVEENSGAIIIYCPSRKMGMKEIRTLVDWKTAKGPLENIEDSRIRGEIKTSITDKHKELWRMLVLVDPKIPDNERNYINGDCEELFGLPSASREYEMKPHKNYVDRYVESWRKNNPTVKLLVEEVDAIKAQLPTRGPEPSKAMTYKEFCNMLKNIRTKGRDELNNKS